MKVVIIIVVYNGMPWIEACLQSCENRDVIVVDNGSKDESISFIKKNFPEVTIIKQGFNSGFGAANNVGISKALIDGADYVFLLNQDAYLCDNVIDKLLNIFNKNPKFGVLSPIHLNSEKTSLDSNFSKYLNTSKLKVNRFNLMNNDSLNDIYEIPFVNAAAWLISRRCLENIGGFDPLFFHYGEDENFCQRLNFHNFSIGVVTNVFIVHDRLNRKKKSIGKFSSSYFDRKRILFCKEYANINENNIITKINGKRWVLFKFGIKNLLLLDIKSMIGYFKEIRLLRKILPKIIRSREINMRLGSHYIKFIND